MLLKQLLQRDNNNLDLVRLIAACMVIYGHANAFLPPERAGGDWVASLLGFDYSGSLAVKMFFFLSGLVVTNSLLEKQSLLQFLMARFFRVWPALMIVLVCCAFVIGPLVTTLALGDYFFDPRTWSYVSGGALMKMRFTLPGVFEGHVADGVNGSLWSIPYEVSAYWMLAALFALGLHRYRWLAIGVVLLISIDPLLPQSLLFSWRSPNAEINSLFPCFAIGALMALFKEQIRIGPGVVFGSLALFILMPKTLYAHYLFYIALFFGILYFFSRPWLTRWRPTADISYGVYLWGWPIQQLLVHVLPDMDVQLHRFSTMILACCVGWVSWHALEKRCVQWGRRCYERVSIYA